MDFRRRATTFSPATFFFFFSSTTFQIFINSIDPKSSSALLTAHVCDRGGVGDQHCKERKKRIMYSIRFASCGSTYSLGHLSTLSLFYGVWYLILRISGEYHVPQLDGLDLSVNFALSHSLAATIAGPTDKHTLNVFQLGGPDRQLWSLRVHAVREQDASQYSPDEDISSTLIGLGCVHVSGVATTSFRFDMVIRPIRPEISTWITKWDDAGISCVYSISFHQ